MEYTNAKKLMNDLGISYQAALHIIIEVQEEMEKKGYLIPNTKQKLALVWMVNKKLGIKDDWRIS